MRHLRRSFVALAAAALLTLAACGDDDDNGDTSPQTETTEATTTTAPSDTSREPSDNAPGDRDRGRGRGRGRGPHHAQPGRGDCEQVSEAPDGIYQVGDAGEVEIKKEGRDTINLVEARPADGWDATDDLGHDHHTVKVKFTKGDASLVFNAKIHHGDVTVQVCNDCDPDEQGRCPH